MWKFLKSGAKKKNSDIMFQWAANKVMYELLFVMYILTWQKELLWETQK